MGLFLLSRASLEALLCRCDDFRGFLGVEVGLVAEPFLG